jgi:hypothetical protein
MRLGTIIAKSMTYRVGIQPEGDVFLHQSKRLLRVDVHVQASSSESYTDLGTTSLDCMEVTISIYNFVVTELQHIEYGESTLRVEKAPYSREIVAHQAELFRRAREE